MLGVSALLFSGVGSVVVILGTVAADRSLATSDSCAVSFSFPNGKAGLSTGDLDLVGVAGVI